MTQHIQWANHIICLSKGGDNSRFIALISLLGIIFEKISRGFYISEYKIIIDLSTISPALTACATLLNLGLSPLTLATLWDLVNVWASHSLTSDGTASGCTSFNASSSSNSLLKRPRPIERSDTWEWMGGLWSRAWESGQELYQQSVQDEGEAAG